MSCLFVSLCALLVCSLACLFSVFICLNLFLVAPSRTHHLWHARWSLRALYFAHTNTHTRATFLLTPPPHPLYPHPHPPLLLPRPPCPLSLFPAPAQHDTPRGSPPHTHTSSLDTGSTHACTHHTEQGKDEVRGGGGGVLVSWLVARPSTLRDAAHLKFQHSCITCTILRTH